MLNYSWVKKYLGDKKGNASLGFAFASLPLATMVVLGLEMSETTTSKSELQSALDAAVLAAATEISEGIDTQEFGDFEAAARQVFEANFDGDGNAVLLNFETNETYEVISGEAKLVTPAVAENFNGETFDEVPSIIRASAEATVDTEKEFVVDEVFSIDHNGEVVFVMDYSSSMNQVLDGSEDKKYELMAAETERLITNLTDNGAQTNVKVGLLPFATFVNMKLPTKYWFDKSASATGNLTRCTWGRFHPHNQTDTPPQAQLFHPTSYPRVRGNADYYHCGNMRYRGIQLRDLTTNYSAAIDQVRAMRPTGLTNISTGMGIAYQMLSPNEPYTQGAEFGDEDTKKIVVLLTDGAQTVGAYGPDGSFNLDNANANFTQTCENMKASGIRVITISYDLQDQDTNERLAACASPVTEEDQEKLITTNAYTASDAASLSFVFGQINRSFGEIIVTRTEVVGVRLSR